jgi:tellurite resistance protein
MNQTDISLDPFQSEAFARGLYAVAHVDGVHAAEEALVAAFWAECGGSTQALAEFGRRQAITAEELTTALSGQELRRLFLRTAVQLAFADGKVSDAERTLICGYAEALGLKEELQGIEDQARDFLMSQLSHVQNVDALAQVAKKLEI